MMDEQDLSAAYARMAEDEVREAEAQEWSDALITDFAEENGDADVSRRAP
jgi:hypothetical protein